jgi:hypothetical protein
MRPWLDDRYYARRPPDWLAVAMRVPRERPGMCEVAWCVALDDGLGGTPERGHAIRAGTWNVWEWARVPRPYRCLVHRRHPSFRPRRPRRRPMGWPDRWAMARARRETRALRVEAAS